MNKNIYEEFYSAGRIKGTVSYHEDYNITKKDLRNINTDTKITLQQCYNLFNDHNISEKKRRKDTINKFKDYLKQQYPLV